MTEDVSELMTMREAAKTLGVHPSTLRNWDRQGKLPAVRVGSRRDRKFRKRDVLAAAKDGIRYATVEDLMATGGRPTLAELTNKSSASVPAIDKILLAELAAPAMQKMLAEHEVAMRTAADIIGSREIQNLVKQSVGDMWAKLSQTIPSFGDLLKPTLAEHELITGRLAETLAASFGTETLVSDAYAGMAAIQAELSSMQAITTLTASLKDVCAGQIGRPVWEQLKANIGAYQDFGRAALWDLDVPRGLRDRRVPFAELKVASALLQSTTSLVADVHTGRSEASSVAVRRPNLFQHFHREARQITGTEDLADLELEAQLRAMKSFRAGNAGLAVAEAVSRVNRAAQLGGRDPVFEPSVEAVTIAARLPLSSAESEGELGEIVDALFKFVFEASGKGRRLRAAADSSEYDTVEAIVVLRNYFRHDLSQGQSPRASRRQLGKVGNVLHRLSGKPNPSSPADWQRTHLALMRQVWAFLTALADKLEGGG